MLTSSTLSTLVALVPFLVLGEEDKKLFVAMLLILTRTPPFTK